MTKGIGAGNAVTGGGILSRPDGATIVYHRSDGIGPGIVFLHGYHSDMTGTKARALEELCRAQGRAFLRFDQFGHGASSGDVPYGTVGRWTEDTVAVLDQLTEGPQILVGSSLGGWLALLAATRRPERVAGLVGIAAAPDFTEDLMWRGFTAGQRRELVARGEICLPNGYEPDHPWRVRRDLIEDGRRHLLLRGPIALSCPVRLIHGQKDGDVPWQTALRIAERLDSDAVEVTLVKDGDHRLSRDGDIARLQRVVADLIGLLPPR